MQKQTEALARRLFRIAEENLHAAGGDMPCTEDVFAVLTDANPDCADYGRLRGLSNPEFVQAVFALLLKRPLDRQTARFWQTQYGRSPHDFQTAVLQAVLGSAEYRKKGIPLLHCDLPVRVQEHAAACRLPFPAGLRRLSRRLPAPVRRLVQNAARRCLHAGGCCFC